MSCKTLLVEREKLFVLKRLLNIEDTTNNFNNLFIKISDLLKFEISLKRKKTVRYRTDMSNVLKSFKLHFNPLNLLYF